MGAEVNVGFHWITFATGRPVEDVMDVLGGGFGDNEARGGYGHPYRFVHESGAAVYHGSRDEAQPVVVNVPGEACEGWAPNAIGWAERAEGWITRLDTACDLGPAEKARRRLMEMYRAWGRGQVDTRMSSGSRQLHKNDGEGEGWTVYFGGKSAALRLRAYDRRGPLRLEWQWRPERDSGKLLPKIAGEKGPAVIWRGLAAATVFPMQWYQDLLKGEGVQWNQAERLDSTFNKAIEQLRIQWGVMLWGLQQTGVKLDDLVRDPGKLLRGDVGAKFMRWAQEATEAGYDGEKLKQEVQCRLKSKRG